VNDDFLMFRILTCQYSSLALNISRSFILKL